MDEMRLCGWSAYQSHRVPPVVRAIAQAFHDAGHPTADGHLDGHPSLVGVDKPLRIMADTPNKRLRSASHVSLLRSRIGDGDFAPHPAAGPSAPLVTHPAATLLTLAPTLSVARLALAAAETLGSFSIFQPSPDMQMALDQLQIEAGEMPPITVSRGASAYQPLLSISDLDHSTRHDLAMAWRYGGWRQVRDTKGSPTSLWRRSPLVSPGELVAYLREHQGEHGSTRLGKAISITASGAASPLEARACLLLCSSRRRGGEALGSPACNARVELTPEAAAIARQGRCYCDLLLKGRRSSVLVDIECQGLVAHDGQERRLSDSDRSMALRCMGIDVLFLTHHALASPVACAEFARKARKLLGVEELELSPGLLAKREQLRREALVNWNTFGIS